MEMVRGNSIPRSRAAAPPPFPANTLRAQSLDEARETVAAVFRGVHTGGRDVARHTGRFTRDVAGSKWVQKAVVGTTVFAILGTLLYIPAALGYILFYYKYLPELETTVPVHLQYGYVYVLGG
jgi:hypothetical protein